MSWCEKQIFITCRCSSCVVSRRRYRREVTCAHIPTTSWLVLKDPPMDLSCTLRPEEETAYVKALVHPWNVPWGAPDRACASLSLQHDFPLTLFQARNQSRTPTRCALERLSRIDNTPVRTHKLQLLLERQKMTTGQTRQGSTPARRPTMSTVWRLPMRRTK